MLLRAKSNDTEAKLLFANTCENTTKSSSEKCNIKIEIMLESAKISLPLRFQRAT